ncbi:MAG: DUF523 domain-containing protein [Magnetococcus sp. YQC-5]
MRIGISACLLGMPVRYDGGHKAWVMASDLQRSGVVFIPICPEAQSGLGVPREPMRLEGDPHSPILKTLLTRQDQTNQVASWVNKRLESLQDEGVSGFLCKSRSPSCGVIHVPVYNEQGAIHGYGTGLFASACMERFPNLPIAEGDTMTDWSTLQTFLARLPHS